MGVGKLFHIIYDNIDDLQSCTNCFDKNLWDFL